MNEDDFRGRVAAGQRLRANTSCPAPERLLALAEGGAPEAERLMTLDHLSQCAACRRELELLRMVGVEPGRARAPRVGWRTMAIAAVVTLAVGFGVQRLTRAGESRSPVLRGPGSSGPGITDTMTVPLQLHWSALREAVTYRVELLETDGAPAFTALVADTLLAVPDSATAAGHTYDMTVRARRLDGRDSLITVRRIRTVRAP